MKPGWNTRGGKLHLKNLHYCSSLLVVILFKCPPYFYNPNKDRVTSLGSTAHTTLHNVPYVIVSSRKAVLNLGVK